MGLPILPLRDQRWFMAPFGNFFHHIQNWSRAYDYRVDNFALLGNPLTFAIQTPIWG
jgi:hypothetical protein